MAKIRPIKNKVVLKKLVDGAWIGVESGYVRPNPPEVGKNVWVGSISSREGWLMTEVQTVKKIPRGVEFTTLNSTYRIVTIVYKHEA